MKFNFSIKLTAVIYLFFIVNLFNLEIYSQCPSIQDMLNQGWQLGPTPSTPTQDNRDEFGITNSSDFFVKNW